MTIRRRTLLGALAATAGSPALAEPTRITVWHSMVSAPGDEFNKLIAKFNARQNSAHVTGLFKAVYKDLLVSVAAAWRAGQAPHLAQIFEVGTETMMAAGTAIKPAEELLRETGVQLDPAIYIPAVRGYYSTSSGNLASIPFNSSTCICWYNVDDFARAGLDETKFPATWPDLVTAARALRKLSAAKVVVMTSSVVWAHFEQFSAIHDLPYATEANGFDGLGAELRINSPAHVRHLQRLLAMAQEGIFTYTGRDGSGDGPFTSGDAAIDFSSSALRSILVNSAKFRWAPAFLPYDPEIIAAPINSVIGGASFWALTAPGRTVAEYRATAEFFRFLSEPEQDAAWSGATGYIPITRGGAELMRTADWLDVPLRQLNRGQVTGSSRGFHLGRMPEIRTIIEEECERAFSGQQDAKTALDNAVARGNRVLREFQRSVPT
jgi:sn-glycerol 3-phosphate transport system substrate-binding protein